MINGCPLICPDMHYEYLRDRPIIRTDLQIQTMFGFRRTHPPTPKSEHHNQESLYTSK